MFHSGQSSNFVIPSTPYSFAILIYSRHYPTLIGLALTTSGEPQLSAHYTGITCVPVVITHCSPCFIEADLHSSLVRHWASYQPDITITADYSDTKLCHINNFSQHNVCLLTLRLATNTCVFKKEAVTSVSVISVCNWIISADSIVVNRKSSTMLTVCKFAVSDLWYSLRTDLGGCKILGE